jgi:hypothetical protein
MMPQVWLWLMLAAWLALAFGLAIWAERGPGGGR